MYSDGGCVLVACVCWDVGSVGHWGCLLNVVFSIDSAIEG